MDREFRMKHTNNYILEINSFSGLVHLVTLLWFMMCALSTGDMNRELSIITQIQLKRRSLISLQFLHAEDQTPEIPIQVIWGAINLIPLKPTDIHSFSARRVHTPASGHNYTLAACLVDYTSYPSNLCVYFIIFRRCCLTRNRWEIFYEWTRLRFFSEFQMKGKQHQQ